MRALIAALLFFLPFGASAGERLPEFLVGYWSGDQGCSGLEIKSSGDCILWFGNALDQLGTNFKAAVYDAKNQTLSLSPHHHFHFDPKQKTLQGKKSEWIHTSTYECGTPLKKVEVGPREKEVKRGK